LRFSSLIACVAAAYATIFLEAPAVHAGVLDRVKAQGVVHCGGAERTGLAAPGADGKWAGLNVELCHAIAVAALGPEGRFDWRDYSTPRDYDAVREAKDEVFFLSAAEIVEQKLAGGLIPGPVVFYQTHAVMTPEDSPARHVEDLAGKKICFLTGGGPQRSLESFFEAKHLDFLRLSFSEQDEMTDAYDVRRCDGIADEQTDLAATRRRGNAHDLASRILPEPLDIFPILASTSNEDGQWAAIVAWTVHSLIRAETREGSWRADGADALPIDGPALGLAADWQKQLIKTVGSYADIYRRTLGEDTGLKLARGANAPWKQGGVLVAPFSE
jgi:general L-amino acid transport system substrate-binding protein